MSRSLLSLSLQHTYYPNGLMPHTEIIPDYNTKTMLERLNMGWLINGAQYQLLSFGAVTPYESLTYLSSITNQPLTFLLTSGDLNFFKMTEFPLNKSCKLNFTTHRVRPSTDGFVDFISEAKTPALSVGQSVGEIEVWPEDVKHYIEQAEALNYRIVLHARNVQWRYCVVNRSQRVLENPVITDDSGVPIDNPKKFLLEKEIAYLFSSGKEQFPIQMNPTKIFKLVNNHSSSSHQVRKSKALINDLPTPGINQVRFERLNDNQLAYAQMYVYL